MRILTGLRRFLAHKQLRLRTIQAVAPADKIDESAVKAISVTENLVRRDVSQKELIDACTSLYKKYGTVRAVVQQTGLPARDVSHYVKYDRLIPALKKLVDDGEADIKVAVRAQDAAAAGGEDANADDAVKLAKELSSMTGVQQKKLVKEREDNPHAPVDEVIETAKTGAKVTQIVVTLTADTHKSLQNYAQNEGDDAGRRSCNTH